MLFEGNLVWSVGTNEFKQVRANTTGQTISSVFLKRGVSFERTLFPRESRKHILLVL